MSLSLGLGVVITSIAAFAFLSYKLDIRQNNPEEKVAAVDEILPQPPPAESEYEFYNILSKEEPVRIQRGDDEDVLASSPNVYYIKVPGYASYDSATTSAKQMIAWGLLNQMKIEPYTNGAKILFSIRIGPFASRSIMNSQRDLLYDKEIANEGLGFRK